MTSIPVFDLERALAEFRPELESRWQAILDSKHFVGGSDVGEFECAFAGYVEAPSCVGVANGTDALLLSLKALGLSPGDEVVVPAFTFAATAATVSWLGGVPVFADVEPASLNLDPVAAEAAITERTVGVIGVHLYGAPFALEEVEGLCSRNNLWLIEDAAQAHGARYRGRRVGAFGDLATWSFYPSKNLGCFGDGGAVTGKSAQLVDRVRLLANHGAPRRYEHVEVGTNSRLDSLQAAVLNCRLPLLEAKNARRRELAATYTRGLSSIEGLRQVVVREGDESVFHQLAVLTARRAALQEFFARRGIGSAVHYPAALPDQAAFESGPGNRQPCLVARSAANEVLCLPMFPEMLDEEVDAVVSAVKDFFAD